MSSFDDIVAAAVARWQTIDGLQKLSKQNTKNVEVGVLDYEPQTLQHSPVFYGILTDFTRVMQGQQIAMTYQMAWRLCIKWTENQTAERDMRRYINLIPATIDQDRTLGGVIMAGGAKIAAGRLGYFDLAAAKYRYCDFQMEILHKEPIGSGI